MRSAPLIVGVGLLTAVDLANAGPSAPPPEAEKLETTFDTCGFAMLDGEYTLRLTKLADVRHTRFGVKSMAPTNQDDSRLAIALERSDVSAELDGNAYGWGINLSPNIKLASLDIGAKTTGDPPAPIDGPQVPVLVVVVVAFVDIHWANHR